MTLTGCTSVAEEQDVLGRIITGAREANEWLATMDALVDDLHAKADDVEVATNRLSGSFVEIIVKASFDTDAPPKMATDVMSDYEWDDSAISEEGNKWRLYLKRRYSIS